MKYTFIVIISILFFQLNSCRTPQSIVCKSIDSIQFDMSDPSQATILASLHFYNPNSFGFNILHMESNISLNNHIISTYIIDSNIRVYANRNITIPIYMKLDLSNVLQNPFDLLVNRALLFIVDGKVTIKEWGIIHTFPIHYEWKQPI